MKEELKVSVDHLWVQSHSLWTVRAQMMRATPGREIFNMSFCKEQTKFQRKLKELYLGKSTRKRSVNIIKTQNKMKQRMVLNFRSIFKRNNRVEKLSNKRHLELSKSFRNKTKTFSSDKRILMIQKAITHERQSPKNLSSTKRQSLTCYTYLSFYIQCGVSEQARVQASDNAFNKLKEYIRPRIFGFPTSKSEVHKQNRYVLHLQPVELSRAAPSREPQTAQLYFVQPERQSCAVRESARTS